MPSPLPHWRQLLAHHLPPAGWRTRFAPAPTGYLHLGHLVNALHVWGIARAHGGTVLLRIEDHDGTRCRPEYEAALLEDLEWLGLHADHFPASTFRADGAQHEAHHEAQHEAQHEARQSNQSARYASALARLDARGLVYACRCTRRDIARLVPHEPGEEPCYPGTCRTAQVPAEESFARRVRLEPSRIAFDDLRLGTMVHEPHRQCGDVLVRDRHAQWTYQFAVTVDDDRHDIDLVIRGEDLLASTGRQLQLAALLGRTRPLRFLHHTLLVHPDGSKLSKASGDTALRELRAAGLRAEQLLAEAARRAGLSQVSTLPAFAIADLFTDN
jgi:glutamyl-tRNA synthetase/glutamyl-Q tRNA(Asp) synthetase